jgi:hypothetical protein
MRLLFLFTIFLFFDDVLAFDLSGNLAVQSMKMEQKANEVKEGHLVRSFLPDLTLVAGEEHFKVESIPAKTEPYGFLEARFNLFKGGKDNLLSEIFQLRTSVSSLKTDLRAREELNKLRKIQAEIIFNNELISILKREKEENLKIKSQANKRASSGIATRTDTLEFTIYDSELEEAIESLKHENKILKIGLAPITGMAADEIEFPAELDHQHDDSLLSREEYFQNHPEVLTLKIENEIFQKEKSIDSRFWLPTLDLYGGHYYNYELINKDYRERNRLDAQAVGIRLTFELFDGMKSSVEATSNQYKADAKRIMSQHMQMESEAKFNMLKEDLIHTHEVMHYVLDRIKKSKDYLRLTLKEYDRGVKNSLDALTAMQRFYRYEKDYLEKKKDYHVIKADLLKMLGE